VVVVGAARTGPRHSGAPASHIGDGQEHNPVHEFSRACNKVRLLVHICSPSAPTTLSFARAWDVRPLRNGSASGLPEKGEPQRRCQGTCARTGTTRALLVTGHCTYKGRWSFKRPPHAAALPDKLQRSPSGGSTNTQADLNNRGAGHGVRAHFPLSHTGWPMKAG